MALFQQCTASTATLASAIADSAGASADTQMVARAGIALGNAIRYFSGYADWDWMRMEAPQILVTAPFSPVLAGLPVAGSATGGGTAPGSISFAVGDITGLGVLPQDFINGPMFIGVAPARVTATASASANGVPNSTTATIGFDNPFNASLWSTAGATCFITANRDEYDLPSDLKQPYSVRLLGAQYTIRYVGRRQYDRSITSEYTPQGTPLYYDTFTFGQFSKIRLMRAPSVTDRMQIRYYRKMNATSATLDCPEQYEPYLTSYATYLFLINKADQAERAQEFKKFAMEGLTIMLKENANQPDADLGWMPGHYSYNVYAGVNSTRNINWDEG